MKNTTTKLMALLAIVVTMTASFAAISGATTGNVSVSGRCLVDNEGPFLGLGFSYMQALRDCKYNRSLYQSELAYMAARGYNYQRMLTMVGGYTYWLGREIAPIGFYNQNNQWIPAWGDYWQQFRDCIDIAYDGYGIRSEITIFADANFIMPNDSQRYAHLDNILSNLAGRTHKVILLEVANESWQNGFWPETTTRPFGEYLTARTGIPVALSAPVDGSAAGIQSLYNYSGSMIDIATVHFSRDLNTVHGHWGPVIDCWDKAILPGVPPVSSNEPIGPGSSVAEETHPIHLVSAACFAFTRGLPMYVYHTNAGVLHDEYFSQMEGVSDFQWVRKILPTDLPNWTWNTGLIDTNPPFMVYSGGYANNYWWLIPGGNDGCHTNAGARNGNQFITYLQGIRAGGVLLEAREALNAVVVNPLNGALLGGGSMMPGWQVLLGQGTEAWIIKGTQGYVSQSPYAGVIPIPGVIEAENFDNGGEGIAYHDIFYGNTGAAYGYRTDQHVDTFIEGGVTGVGWIETGEWLNYTVNVQIPGLYTIGVNYASPNSTGVIRIRMAGVDVAGGLPSTGGWTNWTTVYGPNINLTAGQQNMQVYVDSGGYNLNWISWTKQ